MQNGLRHVADILQAMSDQIGMRVELKQVTFARTPVQTTSKPPNAEEELLSAEEAVSMSTAGEASRTTGEFTDAANSAGEQD